MAFFIYLCTMKYIIALSLFILTGCTTSHYYNQATKFHNHHKEVCDSLANAWYPVRFKVVEHTKYLPGIPTVQTDTQQVHDTQMVNTTMLVHDTVRINRTFHRTDTVKITDTITKVDTAELSLLRDRLSKCITELTKCQENAKSHLNWAVGEGLVILALVLIIYKLAQTSIRAKVKA